MDNLGELHIIDYEYANERKGACHFPEKLSVPVIMTVAVAVTETSH